MLSTINHINKREEVFPSKTINSFYFFIDIRSHRIITEKDGLPTAMCWTLKLCAIVSIIVSYFFYIDDSYLHKALTSVLAIIIALLIFLITFIDNPFKIDFSVSEGPYIELVQSTTHK